jgi:hypothetical protein
MHPGVLPLVLACTGLCRGLVQNVTIAATIKSIYWADASCKGRTNQHGYQIWDVLMAGKGLFTSYVKESLSPEPVMDTDLARVFDVLFNVAINSKDKFEKSDNFKARFKRSGSSTPKKMVLGKSLSTQDPAFGYYLPSQS